ncbi:A/G-specific DNA-adenine glycosylase [Kineothrix alysoides]|uniref:Sugar fermentation stimulation protein homolog n=1 Tax=Kineothrix alysoides TaxID=1469948 RepID=A0A4R1R580_9FIRM|nr:A/G-specific DNA-adenine glycosylase [Kineothrix alysoides]
MERPNRFIAYVEINGKKEKVHVKNTGRCRELLTPGATVYLEKSDNGERATAYDLVSVKKGERMINMDSSAPNKAVHEWLLKKELFPGLKNVYPEKVYRNSRFDFYIETEEEKIFLEVKGVTLEKDNAVYFPDAPSERAVKHVGELAEAIKEGYSAYIVLVVQMKEVDFFAPNVETHPAFAQALLEAREAGVKILAYDCEVTPDSMELRDPVPVVLTELDLIAKPLLSWYDRGRRILPWRENPMPYYVWLSEIMLQQTRVEAVKPYFDRFIGQVPDVKSLACLEEERLVKLWEGLGYYNRVRNLQRAAKIIMEKYEGIMPSGYEKLMDLPGIGSYTAGAIASIAYGKAVPAVDGNVLRVLSRLRMDGEDILSQKTKSRVEKELGAVIPEDRPGDFNQALMELGATVCLPNGAPKCMECPWKGFCKAHLQDKIFEFPKKKSKKERIIEEKTVLVIKAEDKAAFEKRPEKGLLAGMYGFPMLEGHRSEEEVLYFLRSKGLRVIRIQRIGEAKHIFSHKEWHMIGYAINIDELEAPKEGVAKAGWIFADKDEARERYPIPAAYASYAKYLDIKLGV